MFAIQCKNVKKRFSKGKSEVLALNDLSLSIESGSTIALLGPNGSGKTTLMRSLCGLVEIDSGEIQVFGHKVSATRSSQARVGVVLEGNRGTYWRLTVAENLAYFGTLKGISKKDALAQGRVLLERFNMADKMDATVQTLSRGMQQKLSIVVAMLGEPKLMILDEPTLGLDASSVEALKAMMNEASQQGSALLLTTHQIDVAESLVEDVALISSGKIVKHGTVAEFAADYIDEHYTLSFEKPISDKSAAEIPIQNTVFDGRFVKHYGTRVEELIYLLKDFGLVHARKEGVSLVKAYETALERL